MTATPSWIAQASTSTGLATRLLDEIACGMKPVWPTTEPCAERLVEGFETLMERRGAEIVRAILEAPRDGSISWSRLLAPLTR